MAIGGGMVPGGDDLLTRDARTIAEYIRLMSFEVLGEEAQGRDRPVERWHQTGLSLTEALDKAEATAARPARLPNLLALAAAIRPVDSSAATAAGGGRTSGGATTAPPSGGTKRKRRDDAGNSPGTAAATAAAGGEPRAGAPGAKRRRVDANAIMCPFELNGVCNDDDCRYQHLDVYLRPSLNPGTSPAPNAASAAANGQPAKPSASDPGGASPVPGPLAAAAAAAAAARTDERPSALGQHRLPAIDFTGAAKRDAVARARDSGRRGVVKPSSTRQPSSETGGGMPTAAEGGTADQAGVGGGNASGELEEAEAVDSGEETTSVDGEEEEEDFLALPTERAENNGGDGGEASSETAAAATPEQASPAVLAKAFALAASGASASGGPGNVVRGAGGSGVGREERYYPEGGDGKTQGAASAALPDDQLSALEAQLNEGASCDVEGWLLLAMHQLPRTGGSVKAVLNTISDVACGASGPMGSVDQAAIKTALRTFVQPLERAEGGQAEVLWLLYLRLFAFLPGKSEDALGMAEYALEKFPTSRRIWRLYRSMLQTSPGWSLSEDVSCYRRQIEALLLLQPRAADMRASPRDGSSSGGGGPGAKATSSGSLGKNKSGDGGTGGTGGGGGGAEANVKMIVYLVLERCSLLAEAGYKLQAAAEILDSLGALAEGQPLWGWDARDGQGRRTLLRTSEGGGHEREGEGGGARREGGGTKAGGSTEASDDDGQRLPAGVAAALKHAPRDSRCVLWLTALHLLVMGVFPHHVLTLAENDCGGLGGSNDTTAAGGGLADLLLWPAEWLSPKSSAILRLSASPDLQDATLKTFMTALSDVGLLPPPRSKGCWAPAIKDRDALLSSAAEAKAARAGGMAPDASALEGPPLVLALNWLAFCLRRGRVDARQGRMMAFACCRRFQLSRPDQPALLEHFLLEHAVSKTRTLGDTYHEISRAFDADGVAAGALRERRDGEGKSASFNPAGARSRNEQSVNLVPPPSGERIQAVYAFLRFVESRLEAARSESESESESANDAGRGALEDARRVLRDALVGMWMGAAAAAASAAGGGAARSDSDRWLEEEGGESVRRALEGAKASLFRWADGGSGGCDAPGGNGERQLSTIVFSLWVLGGASAAIGSLDHILSAESFSGVSAERKRLAWLQRLEAAMILSTQQQQKQQASGVDAMQGVREVALRALADHRTERRAGYPSLAHFVAATLDRPPATESPVRDSSCQPGKSLSRYTPSAPLATDSAASSSSFACDVLTVYANHFREARRGGVDWVVAAEALGGVSAAAAAAAHASCAALALLRWVSWADHDESGAVTAASLVDGASALKANARPYVEMALAMNPADTALCGAVAALWAATGSPDLAQRVLEAALRAHPYCAELWEQRVALEAGFGSGSTERAGATAAAAAGSRVMLRLRCGGKLGGQTPSGLQARTAGRIATAISHPPSRRETKSFSLQAALRAPPGSSAPVAAAAMATIEVPRSIFLMTSLTSLSLAFNGLLSVPAAIGSLSVLRSLDVSGNALASLPQSLSRLSGTLRLLRAAGNRLQSPLSAATPIGDLVGLRVLDLENNELSNFPGVVVPTLTQLRSLKLAGNEFSERAPAGLSDALPFLEELSLPSLA
ncbi:Hypothetical leucine rich repeat protein [Ectocarpus siliculosus]|uniref:Hypothetical leucine rich repeat protein n=1 Tax=Ectocarpus siliculosus TaxID=2880 RepID=D8LUC8_ECTSI|nr:Hypothetical leucine rich repeat protein [Ectocarpus siliculosus]|eukprot:CBN75469.1 Hypothetical leucine rich repeat protein [Ectocarpus siliculosus]